ncbi:MAG TPA: hypothetical protein VM884_08840 [Flavisolibacter sp.]|nr:hypothetical protein [Flavisolibacter sp.]
MEGIYSIHDHRLLLSGAGKTGSLYFCFAADGWVASPYFEKELLLDNKKTAYVFNLSAHKADWNCFIQGRYPEFSPFLKERIKSFFGSGKEWDYVETFLYPEKLAGYQSPWHYYEGSHGSGFHRSWVGNPSDPYDLSKLEMLRM